MLLERFNILQLVMLKKEFENVSKSELYKVQILFFEEKVCSYYQS